MALFKRRNSRTFMQKTRQLIWPSMGWKRAAHYYYHRIFRGGLPAHRITGGLATGAAVSWSPFMGTHILHVVFLSWLCRVHLLSGVIGTVWGNPWTFPIMYWIGYEVGVGLCSIIGLSEFVAFPEMITMDYFLKEPWSFIVFIFSNPLKLLLPLTLGGYVCALIFWPIAFAILYYPVYALRKAYVLQRLKRLKKRREQKEMGSSQ